MKIILFYKTELEELRIYEMIGVNLFWSSRHDICRSNHQAVCPEHKQCSTSRYLSKIGEKMYLTLQPINDMQNLKIMKSPLTIPPPKKNWECRCRAEY